MLPAVEWGFARVSYCSDTGLVLLVLLVLIGDRVNNVGRLSQKFQNSTPRSDTARARPRLPPAEPGETSKVGHEEAPAHREVDLIASKPEQGLKPCL